MTAVNILQLSKYITTTFKFYLIFRGSSICAAFSIFIRKNHKKHANERLKLFFLQDVAIEIKIGRKIKMDSTNRKDKPSIDAWLKEAKEHPNCSQEGMFLVHNGIVRETPKAQVREGVNNGSLVVGMTFSYDAEKVDQATKETYKMPGIYYIRTWLNEGVLQVGDDIMYVLIGGDIRPHVVDALQFLVSKIKNECVIEVEQQIKR